MLTKDQISLLDRLLLDMRDTGKSYVGAQVLKQTMTKYPLNWSPSKFDEALEALKNLEIISVRRGGSYGLKKEFSHCDDATEISLYALILREKAKYAKEDSLYNVFHSIIEKKWASNYRSYIVRITANKGKGRGRQGTWIVPDIIIVGKPHFTRSDIHVVSFEVKLQRYFDVKAVAEAESHSVFANQAYVLAYTPDQHEKKYTHSLSSAKQRAIANGIGIITTTIPDDVSTWNDQVNPQTKTLDYTRVLSELKRLLDPVDLAIVESW